MRSYRRFSWTSICAHALPTRLRSWTSPLYEAIRTTTSTTSTPSTMRRTSTGASHRLAPRRQGRTVTRSVGSPKTVRTGHGGSAGNHAKWTSPPRPSKVAPPSRSITTHHTSQHRRTSDGGTHWTEGPNSSGAPSSRFPPRRVFVRVWACFRAQRGETPKRRSGDRLVQLQVAGGEVVHGEL